MIHLHMRVRSCQHKCSPKVATSLWPMGWGSCRQVFCRLIWNSLTALECRVSQLILMHAERGCWSTRALVSFPLLSNMTNRDGRTGPLFLRIYKYKVEELANPSVTKWQFWFLHFLNECRAAVTGANLTKHQIREMSLPKIGLYRLVQPVNFSLWWCCWSGKIPTIFENFADIPKVNCRVHLTNISLLHL